MINPYIINVGNIFPSITNIFVDIYNQKDFWKKKSSYNDIAGQLFGYATQGKEFTPNVNLPNDILEDMAQRMRENVKKFTSVDGVTTSSIWGGPARHAIFVQYEISNNMHQQILDLLPDEMQQHKITFGIQITNPGQFIMPHQDHERTSTLFYLLTVPDSETRFYKQKKDFKVHHFFRTVSVNDVELDHSETIQQGSWYIFNNMAYHSVHALDQSKPINRVSFVIEFIDLPFDRLVKLIEDLKVQNKI